MQWQKTLSNGQKQYEIARNNMQQQKQYATARNNMNGKKQYAMARNNTQRQEIICNGKKY